MSDKRDPSLGINGGFLQKSGNGIGPQILVAARNLSDPANPTPEVEVNTKGRKTHLSAMGLCLTIIKRGDPDYAKCLDQANKYRKIRMKELAQLHGHVSAGAGALLASASLALASSRFLYQRAAESGDTATLKQAAQLADSARQSELAAWEVAAKEGVLKRRTEAAASGMPWLQTVAGVDKAKTGRKTNAQRQARDNLDPPTEVLDSGPEDTDA